jgi:serine protease AprX
MRARRGRTRTALAALVVALLPATAHASPVDAGRPAALQPVFVVPAVGQDAGARAAVRRLGGRPGRRIAVAQGFVAQVPASRVAALRGSSAVRAAAPDTALHVSGADDGSARAATATTVVRAASGAQPLDDGGTDGSGVGIALVDSGVMTVPGLDDGQVVTGPDFSTDAADRRVAGRDAFGHGTHLAGVITGRDGDFSGVAPGARVISVKVADGDGLTSLLRVLAGLDWVRRHADDAGARIRVVNLSLGVEQEKSGYIEDPLAYAAETLWKDGLVVVAAAGNNGAKRRLDIPAADPYLLAVGALDTAGTAGPGDDAVADFSSQDARRPPDVVAPGTGVVSLRVPGSALDLEFPAARVGTRFFRGSGTSQAAAVVSGLAALLLERRPGLSPDQVKALLRAGAGHVAGGVAATGAGRVDAAASAALGTPDRGAVAQRFPDAVLDLRQLEHRGRDKDRVGAGAAQWNGRRWSGRRWSGRRWSGAEWVVDHSGRG